MCMSAYINAKSRDVIRRTVNSNMAGSLVEQSRRISGRI